MSEDNDDPQEGISPSLQPSAEMQWAFFKVITLLTCLIIAGTFIAFLLYRTPWCFTLDVFDIPLGGIWLHMAKHLFPPYYQRKRRRRRQAKSITKAPSKKVL